MLNVKSTQKLKTIYLASETRIELYFTTNEGCTYVFCRYGYW